jgi:cupin fold WbuC family metalloprotein
MTRAGESMAVPLINAEEVLELKSIAQQAARSRHAKILHAPGDYENKVFNAMLSTSYMQPHLHPGVEKVEKIHLVIGKLAIVFFDNRGHITKRHLLTENGLTLVEVPAYQYHTYIILSEFALTYETMDGVYDPKSWKEMAKWAPPEQTQEAAHYLAKLHSSCVPV